MLLCVITFFLLASSSESTVCNQPIDRSLLLSYGISSNGTLNCTTANTTNKTFCFDNATSSSNSFSVSVSTPLILRSIEFVSPYKSDVNHTLPVIPSSVRIQSTVTTSDTPQWYRSRQDRDLGIPWTSVSVTSGGVASVPDGFEFTDLQVWPSAPTIGPMDFEPLFYGCLSNETEIVRLEFNSTKSAIETTFSAMQFFEQAVSQIISDHTNISDSRYVVHAGDTVNGIVKVYVRLLPDSAPSAESVSSLMKSMFGNKLLIKALQALQGYVEDMDASLCHNKFCESGWLCVGGRCYNQDGDSMLPNLIPPPTQLRISNQQLRFYAESGSTSTSDSTSMDYIVPIAIGGVLLLGLVGVLVNHVINSKRARARMGDGTREETASLISETRSPT